jgi:hypothetical protein
VININGMRKIPLIASAFIVAGCSSSTSAFVRHACGAPVLVSVSEIGDDLDLPTITSVPANADTEVWNYCCDPGYEPDIVISAGEWSTTVKLDDLWDNGAPVVIELPAEACAA